MLFLQPWRTDPSQDRVPSSTPKPLWHTFSLQQALLGRLLKGKQSSRLRVGAEE